MTSYTSYPSRRYEVSVPALHKKPRRHQDLYAISRVFIRHIQDKYEEHSGILYSWHPLQGLSNMPYPSTLYRVKMDDLNITMELYIQLKEEKARRRAIVFNDALTSEVALSCKPTVSPLNDNQFDFRISLDESNDEDYMVIYDKNSFSYNIIYVNDLKTGSENDNKVNMPSFSSSEPTVNHFNDFDYFKDFEKEFPAIAYNDALMSKLDFLPEPTISPQHINEFNLKNEALLSECDGEEQNVIKFNDLFPFNVIYPDDLKSELCEKPWKLDGIWKEPVPVKHRCEPFNYKNRCFEWPTCSWKDDGYCNGRNLPGQYQVGNQIHYQDHEWYEALKDSDMKREALRNKAELERSMNQEEGSSSDS
ncbi:hypothetical protein Tco_0381005 [Tanacetum coccineum]